MLGATFILRKDMGMGGSKKPQNVMFSMNKIFPEKTGMKKR